MDSRPDTYQHIHNVQTFMTLAISNLLFRSLHHDQSKLVPPEVEVFDVVTEKLEGLTYGSHEYKQCLREMGPALEHHYENNTHHPEHFENGIRGMSLMDLIEMLVDWKAASLRHSDGDLLKSIEINAARFNYSPELKQILLNTVEELGIA